MKGYAIIALAGLAIGGVTVAAASQGPAERERAAVARILAGRTAGPPVSCVDQRLLRGNRSLDDGGILFGDATDSVVYVNHPAGGCPSLDGGRFLVTRSSTGQLCSGDIATVRESGPGPQIGSCGLGEFTPYRRADRR